MADAQLQEVLLRPRAESNYLARSRTALVTGRDGFVEPATDQGLFVHKTRIISQYGYLLNGKPPLEAGFSGLNSYRWLGYYIIEAPASDSHDRISGPGGSATQNSVELRLSRVVGEGLRERATLTNFTQKAVTLTLELLFDADFADMAEVEGKRQQKGELTRQSRGFEGDTAEVVFDYTVQPKEPKERGLPIRRQAVVRVSLVGGSTGQGRRPRLNRRGVKIVVDLPPQGQWTAETTVTAVVEGEPMPLPGPFAQRVSLRNSPARRKQDGETRAQASDTYERQRASFLEEATSFSHAKSSDMTDIVVRTLEQARQDLAALRLHDLDGRDGEGWTLGAGQPVYSELFGRDTLTASWQSAMLGPEMMRGTLRELARWQGKKRDDWRDEMPGKMPHQVSIAPVATLGFNPFDRYYGSITTSGFYPLVVSQLWHWTGDKTMIEPFIDSALAGLEYLDRHADQDGDGFYEYHSRAPKGLKNQAWKDSDDAIVYEDGSQVPAPIATCEEQAFVYVAKFHFSEVLWRLGRRDEARRLYREAGELKKRFNETFWMDDEDFIAMALDPDKRLVRSAGSNPGHCLATGIVDESLVGKVADRLMSPELFSGWGIRTLSALHPAFNPYSYHRGSVWPVEQGSFGLGFWRYGLHDHGHRLAKAVFEAAALYQFFRLPELFAGHQRDEDHPFPALYPQACWPQAWSSSAVLCLLQAMLGLYPYAPLNVLVVDPRLPDWLPMLTVEGLRVGQSRVTLRFYREKDGDSDYEVVDKQGPLHVVRQPSPWSMTSGPLERVVDLFESLATL